MKYITVEQFLKVDVKVQQAILKWWKPSVGDLYCNLYNNQRRNVFSVDKTQLSFKSFANDIKLYGVPLLTEGQLREFIEEITDSTMDVMYSYINYGYEIYLNRNYEQFVTICSFKIKSDSLLQVLWQVANKIIKGDVRNEEM